MSRRNLNQGRRLSELSTYQVGVIEAAAHRALRKHKDELLNGYGITGMEWYIIGTVADAGKQGLRTTDLANMLDTTLGFMTKNLNLLVAKKILIRKANAEDSRSTYVVLNPTYRKTFEEIEYALRAKLRQSVYSLITPEELKTYIQVISKFTDIK